MTAAEDTHALIEARPVPTANGTALTGLSEAEAARRRAQGQGNALARSTTRSYSRIVRDNAFMSINVIIFIVGAALVLMGLITDAIVTVGLVLLNVLIAVIQEVRAKRTLDRIALLSRIWATVIRDGAERQVDPAEIVLGDLLVAGPGDQVQVDGRIVAGGRVELDESLLTGEADPVAREQGDPIYSGSFCLSGRATYEATRVGEESLASTLTVQARAFRPVKTPVQREVDLVLRLMIILVLVLGGPIVLDLMIRLLGIVANAFNGPFATPLRRAYQGYSVQETVRAVAVVIGLVPQGLALMLSVSYALGAVRLAGRDVLLQQANAVESLSHVDVVCFDKTGTLTTNRLAWHAMHPLAASGPELADALGAFAAATGSPNKTIDAIRAAFPGRGRPVLAEVPFASARKWSALTFGDGRTLVLGAPEMLRSAIGAAVDLGPVRDRWLAQGLRVLLLAEADFGARLVDADGAFVLPDALRPLGLLSLSDELQPDAPMTIARFAEAGIALKIISGDHPETVAALARQAGFGDGSPAVVSGLDLAGMGEAAFATAAERGAIFGRIAPEQKLRLIRALQQQGHYVAMVGDGVNDVLAIKQAEVGVAMEYGSQASRAVADVVLLRNAFTALPAALVEGQRIVRASQDLLKLFLSRSLSMSVVILAAGIVAVAFPFMPVHNALPAWLTLGLPTPALAAWARPGKHSGAMLRHVLSFVLPASLSIGMVEATMYISYVRATGDIDLARTVLNSIAVVSGLLLILFVEPPSRAWTGGDVLSGDWRPVALIVVLGALFLGVLTTPAARAFFDLTPLGWEDALVIAVVVAAWAVALRQAWRADLVRRLLGPGMG